MSISFVTIQEQSSVRWNVVKKTFPVISEPSPSLTISVTFANRYCEDQKTAEVAARAIAESYKLPFVSQHAIVITMTPVLGCYRYYELRPNGTVIDRDENSATVELAIENAHNQVESDVVFLSPWKNLESM